MITLAPNIRPAHQCRPLHRRMATWLLATAAFLLTQAAVAASLQVSPISLEFSPEEQAQGIWLSNTGTVPLRAQVRVQQWSQADGSDQLAPARDMTASPPMLEIAAGARQLRGWLGCGFVERGRRPVHALARAGLDFGPTTECLLTGADEDE